MGHRILRISGEFFAQIFSGEKHYRVIKDAIPADAHIFNVKLDFPLNAGRQTVTFLMGSESWSEVPDGEPIPELATAFKSLVTDTGFVPA